VPSLLAPFEEEQVKSLLAPQEEARSLLASLEPAVSPILSFETPELPIQQPSVLVGPQETVGLATGKEPTLAFIEPSEGKLLNRLDEAPIPPAVVTTLQMREGLKDLEAFFRGGPGELQKDKARRQSMLALSEEPLTRAQGFRLDLLTNDLDALDPERQVDAATFILDNFNSGLAGDKAIEPRLPPRLTGAAGLAYQVAGGISHLSGFGVSLALLNKYMKLPEFTPKILTGVAKKLKSVNAQKSFRLLIKNKELAKRMLSTSIEFGTREALTGAVEGDTALENIFFKAKDVAQEAALGAAFVGGAKILSKPINKLVSSKVAQEFVGQSTFGSLIGLTQPVGVKYEDDPLEWVAAKLGNAGMGAAAFSLNHALWRGFPALGRRYFKWRNKARTTKRLNETELEEGRRIFNELEELTLKSKIVETNEAAKEIKEPPFFGESTLLGEPRVKAPKEQLKFVSPASPKKRPITRSEATRTATVLETPLVSATPEARAQRLVSLLESDPLTHPEGIKGFTREIRELGKAGAFNDVIKPLGIVNAGLAPTDVAALKTNTYESMVKGLMRGDDIAFLETNDFAQRYDRLNEILHIRKGAKSPKAKARVNQEAFRKVKDKSYNPETEKDPVVRNIMKGVKKIWRLFAQEEKGLGYTYNENELNYVPELAKTPEARRRFEEERISYATKRDLVSGEVFLPSALRKTGREGTIEDLFLQAKFRARAFSQVKNLSKPALEYSVKLDAMRKYLKPEVQAQLNTAYDLLVRHTRNDWDRVTDNSLNGLLKMVSKVTPFKNLVDRYGGPGVARQLSGKSGRLQYQSFFLANSQFYIRNRAQISQVFSLVGPRNGMQGVFKNVRDFPELQQILETDPEIASFYQRTKAGAAAIDAPISEKGILVKLADFPVKTSHMSNVDGSAIGAYLQSRQKVAKGKWTPKQGKQNIYWVTRLAQYGYDPARVPAIFRTAIGREAFRFKSWGINKIFYLQEHMNRIITGHTGFGAPLDPRDKAYSVMQILWELGIPSIKQGVKSVPALQILDQMRAMNAIPSEAAKLFGVTESLMEDLGDIFKSDMDEKQRNKAIKSFTKKAILTWTPGGNSLIKKFSRMKTRGFQKSFLFPPAEEDYKEWAAEARKKRARDILQRPQR
jgi:hypothetical protein